MQNQIGFDIVRYEAIDQTQTRVRKPPTSVPSSNPTFENLRSLARTLPSWFIVAPQRNLLFTCSRMVVVFASPTELRKSTISVLNLLVLLIMPHLSSFLLF